MKLRGKKAIITGASQGIGKAIAAALSAEGASITLLGRSHRRLEEAGIDFGGRSSEISYLIADLSNAEEIARIANEFCLENDRLDILVNCGGCYVRGPWADVPTESLQELLRTNVAGPYALTQALIPCLEAANGDVVFINSSIVKGSGAGASQFAATQHALKSLADSLRAEVNARGIRVSSIYPGQTATPRQETICAELGREFRPQLLLQPEDIADAVLWCVTTPENAEVTDVHIRQRHAP